MFYLMAHSIHFIWGYRGGGGGGAIICGSGHQCHLLEFWGEPPLDLPLNLLAKGM